MFRVSRTNPAYYLTSVTHHRLPIFRTDHLKEIVCRAFDEARRSGGFMIFAYVIMPDHTHVITDSSRGMTEVLRYLNGISAKRVIDHLKANGHEASLAKLRIQERENKHKHSVYQHHPNGIRIAGEASLFQKIQYLHLNPVRANLAPHPDEYRYSSARLWHGRPLADEPLNVDLKEINWRK